jgi:hypothetical protein
MIEYNDVDGIWNEAVAAKLRYYPGIFLQRLRKTKKNLKPR